MALPRDTPASSPPPSAFGRFRVVHQVGAGVLGPVFRGYDPEHDRAVAIKAFSLDLTPEQARDLAVDLDRLPTLSLNHPSIIAPYAGGADGSTAYLVQEYFVAESADVALKQYGPAPVPDAMRLIGQLAGALDFAMAAGVHHGALHPRDILVAPHEVRVSGLGIVEALERVGCRTPVRRPYAAPERVAGMPFGTQADVFSLAGVAYELLTGRRPAISGESVSVEIDAIQSADPGAMAEVFARALSARPEDRFPSALGFAAALKHSLTGEPLAAGEVVERPRTRRGPRVGGRRPAAAPADARADAPAATESAAGELPLVAVSAEGPGPPLEAPPPPGSTPLPAFLEAYRPGADEPPEPTVAPPEEGPSIESGDAVPDLDLDELDRRTERTTALPIAVPVSPRPERPEPVPVAAPRVQADEDLDHRVEQTFEVPMTKPAMFEPPADADGPIQPTLRLDEPEGAEEPPRGRAVLESERPVTPSSEPRSKNSLVALVGMLIVGFLLGLPFWYFMAPRSGPAGAPAASADAASPAPPSAQAAGSPSSSTAPSVEPVPMVPPPAGANPPAAAPAGSAPPPQAIASSRMASPSATAASAPARPSQTTPGPAAAPRAKPVAGQAPATPSQKKAARPVFEGSLVIASKPAGASVQLDGHPIGTTPLTMQAVSAGAHAVRLELAGYQVWSSAIQVTSAKVNRVTASLERRPGG